MEASQKRELRYLKARNHKKGNNNNNIIEAAFAQGGSVISHSTEEGGSVTRMKILVRKQDLKQALQVMTGGGGAENISNTPSLSLEQRLNLMRKRQILRMRSSRRNWRPVLQSIPEEC